MAAPVQGLATDPAWPPVRPSRRLNKHPYRLVLLIGILLVAPYQVTIDHVQVDVFASKSHNPNQRLPAVALGVFMSLSRSSR